MSLDDTLHILVPEAKNNRRSVRETVPDVNWLKNTFMLGDNKEDRYNKWLRSNRFFSSADIKSGGTGPGMSISINPLPQITRYADIRRPGTVKIRDNDGEGMRVDGVPGYHVNSVVSKFGLGYGRYYSEAIDDNQQRIFLRFGEPQYISMLLWLGKSFDIHKAILLKRGVITKVLAEVISIMAGWFAFKANPIMWLGTYVLTNILQPDRFISMKDNMYTYWTVTETILNKMFVKRTKVPYIFAGISTHGVSTHIGVEPSINSDYLTGMNQIIPGIVDPQTGRISVWSIALRGQAAFNRAVKDGIERGKKAKDSDDLRDYTLSNSDSDDERLESGEDPVQPSKFTKWFIDIALDTIGEEKITQPSTASQFEATIGNKFSKELDDMERSLMDAVGAPREKLNGDQVDWDDGNYASQYTINTNITSINKEGKVVTVNVESREAQDNPDLIQAQVHEDHKSEGVYDTYGRYLVAALTSGAAFLVLNVDSTGSVGESFSNSADNNPIETLFNALSTKIRSNLNAVTAAFELPFIGPAIKAAIDLTSVAIDSASAGLASPLLALMYSATVSLPKSWSQSSAAMPRASYKIKLTTPYGNPYSQLFNMYLPLSAIMAASLPRATGSDTYTAPFMLQLYDKGRVNIPYGMVESLSITRGTSNLAFTRSGHPNAIDIDLSILDLNQIIALDIDGSGILTRSLKFAPPKFTDTSLDVYVSTVTGLDVYNMYYDAPRYAMKLTEKFATWKALFTDSAAHAAMTVRLVPFLETFAQVFGGNQAVEQYNKL